MVLVEPREEDLGKDLCYNSLARDAKSWHKPRGGIYWSKTPRKPMAYKVVDKVYDTHPGMAADIVTSPRVYSSMRSQQSRFVDMVALSEGNPMFLSKPNQFKNELGPGTYDDPRPFMTVAGRTNPNSAENRRPSSTFLRDLKTTVSRNAKFGKVPPPEGSRLDCEPKDAWKSKGFFVPRSERFPAIRKRFLGQDTVYDLETQVVPSYQSVKTATSPNRKQNVYGIAFNSKTRKDVDFATFRNADARFANIKSHLSTSMYLGPGAYNGVGTHKERALLSPTYPNLYRSTMTPKPPKRALSRATINQDMRKQFPNTQPNIPFS